MPRGKYKQHDDTVLSLLKHGPQTAIRLGAQLHIGTEPVLVVFRRLKAKGKIFWPQESVGARLKCEVATKDPSPFPRPGYRTPKSGWFG